MQIWMYVCLLMRIEAIVTGKGDGGDSSFNSNSLY